MNDWNVLFFGLVYIKLQHFRVIIEMKTMKRLVKEQDMFGHPVTLNFNKKGSTANTLLGGLCSILVKLFLIVFVLFRL